MNNHHPEGIVTSSNSGASHRQDNTRAILSKLAKRARGVVKGQVAAAQGGRWLGTQKWHPILDGAWGANLGDFPWMPKIFDMPLIAP